MKCQVVVLEFSEISSGIEQCLDNIHELVDDAFLLQEKNRYARATVCLLTAIQEVGKIQILTKMANLDKENAAGWKMAWIEFYNHRKKITRGFLITDIVGARDIDISDIVSQMDKYFHSKSEHEEELRQNCFYVDFCQSERQWISPTIINAEIVAILLNRVMAGYEILKSRFNTGFYKPRALEISFEENKKGIGSDIDVEKRIWKRLLAEKIISQPEEGETIQGMPIEKFLEL